MINSICSLSSKALRGTSHWMANRFNTPVLVLIYHRVTTLATDPQLLAVSAVNFREHVRIIKSSFPILRFEEDWLKAQKPSIVITFDDGYADNVLEALPILEEEGVPATFFCSTGSIDSSEEYWWDELERIILLPSQTLHRFLLKEEVFGREWVTSTMEERGVLYQDLHPLMKRIDKSCRDNWLHQLRSWSSVDSNGRVSHRPMKLKELRTLAASPNVTVGAHTVNHTSLSYMEPKLQRQEIFQSKKQLENWLNQPITVFSYPFGGHSDYTPETVKLVKEAGFLKAASNFPGQWHSWTDPFQVPRQLVRNWDGATFIKRLKRFWIT